LLEIENFSTLKDIKRGFRNLALKYHPDRSPTDQGSYGRFMLGADAYRFLRNPNQKNAYDIYLKDSLRDRSVYRRKNEVGQAQKTFETLYIKRYFVGSDRKCFVDQRGESLSAILQKAPGKTVRRKVYNRRQMDSEEFDALVQEGRDNFQNYLNSLPKIKEI
jgi:curved DNA-binding protein CbpA